MQMVCGLACYFRVHSSKLLENHSFDTFLPAEGEDFSGTSGNITLAPGNTELCVNIPITDDKNIEPPESFAVTFMFMEVPPGTTSPPPISAMVTIIDNGTKPGCKY